MESSADADLPSWSAPGDATLQSLLAGVFLGLLVALATLVALTQSASQWAALAARLWMHAPQISTAISATLATYTFVQLGCRKWKQHAAIKAEVTHTRAHTRVAPTELSQRGGDSRRSHA